MLVVKGAPDVVLDRCSSVVDDDGAVPIDGGNVNFGGMGRGDGK